MMEEDGNRGFVPPSPRLDGTAPLPGMPMQQKGTKRKAPKAQPTKKRKPRGKNAGNAAKKQKTSQKMSVAAARAKIKLPALSKKKLNAALTLPDPTRKVPRFWTPEDDAYLREAVMKNGEQRWTQIAKMVPGRNAKECVQRWKKVLAPGLKKGKWSQAEDDHLVELIKKHGLNWSLLSEYMKTRSSKQCRERWMNHLNPDLKKSKWTQEEDAKLLQLAALYPRKWAEMARGIPGRTENMAKCRYHTLVRRKAKLEKLKSKSRENSKKKKATKSATASTPRKPRGKKAAAEPMLQGDAFDDFDSMNKQYLNSGPNPYSKSMQFPNVNSNNMEYPALLKAAASMGYSNASPPFWFQDYQKTFTPQSGFNPNM